MADHNTANHTAQQHLAKALGQIDVMHAEIVELRRADTAYGTREACLAYYQKLHLQTMLIAGLAKLVHETLCSASESAREALEDWMKGEQS